MTTDLIPTTRLQETQQLIGELMAIGYDPSIMDITDDPEEPDFAAALPAGDSIWWVTSDGTMRWFATGSEFVKPRHPADYFDYLHNQGEGCTPEQIAIWIDRGFVEVSETIAHNGNPLPVPLKTIPVAKAPDFTRRDIYQDKWMLTLTGLRPGQELVNVTGHWLTATRPHGVFWEESGIVDGEHLFVRTRYIAQADGSLHLYDSTGKKMATHPADRVFRILTKV